LDLFYFHPENTKQRPELTRKDYTAKPSVLDAWQYGVLRAYKDYWSKKFTLRDLSRSDAGRKAVGMSAAVYAEGFRNDGSYYYGRKITQAGAREDAGFRTSLERIAKGESNFRYAERASAAAFEELESLLNVCAARNIHVVAFLPPYAHEVYAKMKEQDSRYAYMDEVRETLPGLFARFNYVFYDYTDLATLHASDEEVIDGYHASEKAYLRLLLGMAERDSELAQYLHLSYLNQRLTASESPYFVFGETA
jgi:hypothetical protein